MKYFVSILSLLVSCSAFAGFVEKTVTVSFPADLNDQVKWQGFAFDSGTQTTDPRFNAPGWDMRLLQGYVSTNGGKALLIKTERLDTVTEAPSDDSQYTADTKYDPSGPAPEDTYNKVLMGWYDYFFWQGHLLAPYPYVFVVHTASDHYAKVQFVDYVKNGRAIRDVNGKKKGVKVGDADGQVHVTLRYRYNDKAGDRAL